MLFKDSVNIYSSGCVYISNTTVYENNIALNIANTIDVTGDLSGDLTVVNFQLLSQPKNKDTVSVTNAC